MLTRERVQAGHTFRLTVTREDTGWTVRQERDSRVVRTVGYTDWHRVERAVHRFETAQLRSRDEEALESV